MYALALKEKTSPDLLTSFLIIVYIQVVESETNDLVDTQESTPAKTIPMHSSINDKKPKGRTSKEFLSKLKVTPKIGSIGKKSKRHKTKVISSSEATLEGKTDTQGIEVEKVETTTSNLELPKYHVHHIPWIYPYQPNSGAMPTPVYPFYSGLPFPHHSHNIGTHHTLSSLMSPRIPVLRVMVILGLGFWMRFPRMRSHRLHAMTN
ncbi:hypothetical protein PIB30_078290 [Stylosanthes scabra]|uniref:Uncharacterized protein n=1 Tax=Stylosanthes scabra TaxID=79078 RepID=A0ABU6SQZ2_9FABA|nr:hypothetical protein [Stylosanthes scabra]